jgi:hypothetical protein
MPKELDVMLDKQYSNSPWSSGESEVTDQPAVPIGKVKKNIKNSVQDASETSEDCGNNSDKTKMAKI